MVSAQKGAVSTEAGVLALRSLGGPFEAEYVDALGSSSCNEYTIAVRRRR